MHVHLVEPKDFCFQTGIRDPQFDVEELTTNLGGTNYCCNPRAQYHVYSNEGAFANNYSGGCDCAWSPL